MYQWTVDITYVPKSLLCGTDSSPVTKGQSVKDKAKVTMFVLQLFSKSRTVVKDPVDTSLCIHPVVDAAAADRWSCEREAPADEMTSLSRVGMRRLICSSERWTYNYQAQAVDNQKTLSCVATVAGLRPVVQSVLLDIDCTYTFDFLF